MSSDRRWKTWFYHCVLWTHSPSFTLHAKLAQHGLQLTKLNACEEHEEIRMISFGDANESAEIDRKLESMDEQRAPEERTAIWK